MLQGSTLRSYPHTRESKHISSDKRHSPPNPGHCFSPRHTSPLLKPERMGGDTAHSTTPQSTHSHKTRLSFLRQIPTRTRHILYKRHTKYSYLKKTLHGTTTAGQIPCDRGHVHPIIITGRLAHASTTCLFHVIRLYQSQFDSKSGPKHLNVHMHHNTTEVHKKLHIDPSHRPAIGTPKQPRRFSRCQSYRPHSRGRTRLLVPQLPKQVIL